MEKFKTYAIIGQSVGLSRSPVSMNTLFNFYGMNCGYITCTVMPGEIGKFIEEEIPKLNVAAFGVTVPHKKDVLPYLDSMDEVSKHVGAVCTVVVGEDGKLKGYMTDIPAFTRSLIEKGHDITKENAVINGCDGEAEICAIALKDKGAKVRICGDDPKEAEAVAKRIGVDWGDNAKITDYLKDCTLFINDSMFGRTGHPEWPNFDFLNALPKDACVYELCFTNPRFTSLNKEAKKRGFEVIDGADWLFCCIKENFEVFTGIVPSEEAMACVAKALFGE